MGTALNIIIVYNQGSFKSNAYGDAGVEKTSTLHGTYSGTEKGYWTGARIQQYELIDETDWL